MNFGPLGYTLEAGQFSLHCLPEPPHNDWDGKIVFTLSSVLLRNQETDSSERQFVLCVLTESKFKSHLKWTYFLFGSRKRNLNLSDNHLLCHLHTAKDNDMKMNLDLGWYSVAKTAHFLCLYLKTADKIKQPEFLFFNYSKLFLQIGKQNNMLAQKMAFIKKLCATAERWFQEGQHWKQTNSPLCSGIVTVE